MSATMAGRRVRGAALTLLASLLVTAHAQEVERAPFITTPDDVTTEMLRFAEVGPTDHVVDLGSGDGRIVIAAARQFGARGLGIEIDPRLVSLSRERARAAGVEDRVSFLHGDVLQADFSRATVVTVYLLPELISRLQPRFLRELEPGTRIVSHAFAMTGWPPDRSRTVRLSRQHEGQGDSSLVHLWVVPADVRGQWRTEGGTAAWQLTIHQNFQSLDVEAKVGGESVAVTSARVEGRVVRWEARGLQFEGTASGDRINGSLSDRGGRRPLELVKRR